MSRTPTRSNSADSKSSSKKKPLIGIMSKKQLSRVTKKILSRSESVDPAAEDQDHLLEDEEPVSVDADKKKKGTLDEEEDMKLKLPSSLVTLTEEEKRQLEDVLMRIGLKECGL